MMKPRVAIICASNPGNAGMYSVDLAAVDFMTRHGIAFELFSSHAPSRFGRYKLLPFGLDIGHRSKECFGRLSFTRLADITQLYSFSHVLYWGDFTPNPAYGYGDFHEVDRRYDVRITKEQSIDKWARLFNLAEGKIKPKTMAVGNNFQHDYSKEIYCYKKFLTNLSSNFDVILPRDPYSVSNLKLYLGSYGKQKVSAGLDPAFLLKNQSKKERDLNNNTFCYFFGRSDLRRSREYVSGLEKSNNLKGVCLSRWLGINPLTADSIFQDYMSNISNARFLVTDLYHLAINGMRLNIPVFCLGNPVDVQCGTIGDFKKKVLFEMLGMEKYYFEIETNDLSEVGRVVEFISDQLPIYEKNISQIFSRKNKLIKRFEDKLLYELQ